MAWARPCAAFLAALSGVACDFLRHGHADGDHVHASGGEHEHPHELPVQPVTTFGAGLELFVEHPFAVADRATRFAVHVTHLEDGSPATSGALRLRAARAAGGGTEASAPRPARPGIFVVELPPLAAGEWTLDAELTDAAGARTVRVETLVVFPDEEAAAHAPPPEAPDGISFLKEQQWRLGTRIEPVARRRIVEEIRVPAFVEAPPAARAKVTAPMAGRLVAAAGWPALGAHVERGAVLAHVEPALHELRVAFAQAAAEARQAALALEQARAVEARVKDLVARELRTPRELEQVEFDRQSAQARVEAAEAVLASWRATGLTSEGGEPPRLALAAPIAGVVTEIAAVPGEFIGVERAVFALLDPSVVHVEARVPEADLPRLPREIEASISVPGSDAEPWPVTGAGGGRLAWRGVEIDSVSRTLMLHFNLPDPEGRLKIGQSLVAHLSTRAASEGLALPATGFVDEDGQAVVFVQLGGETFEKREVELGARAGGWVEVRSGLAEGERVVVEGAYAVRLASVSTTLPAHGHAH